MTDGSDVIDAQRKQLLALRELEKRYEAADGKLADTYNLERNLRELQRTFTQVPPRGVGLTSVALSILLEQDERAASKQLKAISRTPEITFPSTWARVFMDFRVDKMRDAVLNMPAPVREALSKLRERDEFDVSRIQKSSTDCAIVCEWLFAFLDLSAQSEVLKKQENSAPAS